MKKILLIFAIIFSSCSKLTTLIGVDAKTASYKTMSSSEVDRRIHESLKQNSKASILASGGAVVLL